MTRIAIASIGAVALAAAACAGASGSARSRSGASGGSAAATPAETGAPGQSRTASASSDAARASTTTEVEGRVERIDRGNNVTLAGTETVGHAFDQLKIDDETEITVDGERATLNEVHPGDEVRASFSGEGDDLRVERLEVVSSGD